VSERADWLLGELSSLAAAIELAEARLRVLYDQRLDLFREAKQVDPPIMNRVIAEHAGVSQPRVSQKLAEHADA
jgi:hypothetical protein